MTAKEGPNKDTINKFHFPDGILPLDQVNKALHGEIVTPYGTQDLCKMLVGHEIAENAKDGDRIGVGYGTTAEAGIYALAQKAKAEGIQVTCVATSRRHAELAKSLGLNVELFEDTLEDIKSGKVEKDLDWGFDGADEVEVITKDGIITGFLLIKGGGRAHTMEKWLARRCKKWICIVDQKKLRREIGKFPVAIEVEAGYEDNVEQKLKDQFGAQKVDKLKGFESDLRNRILYAFFGEGRIRKKFEKQLNKIRHVIDNGIFDEVQPAEVRVACPDGHIETFTVGDKYNADNWVLPDES